MTFQRTKNVAWFKPNSLLDKVFEGSLLLKGLSAALELIGACLLLFIPSHTAFSFIESVTQRELIEDPHDFVATAINIWGHSLWGGRHTFAIIFLFTHAIIKFIIVIGLLRNERWAYPFSFVTLALMIAYQILDMVHKFSFGMLFITLFDIFIVWLVWREYKKLPLKTKSTKQDLAPSLE